MKKTWWLVMAFLITILVGCSPSTGNQGHSNSSSSSTSPNSGNPASNNNPNNPPNSSGNSQPSSNNSSGNSNTNINIPSTNKSAPSGILEQISWGGQGGESGPTFEQPCGNCNVRLQGTQLSLTGFNPSQRLEIPIYRYSEGDCSLGSANHVITINVQVGQNGTLVSSLSGSTDKLVLSVIYDSDTGEAVWFSFIGYKIDEYLECSALKRNTNSSCPGAPTQRLNIGEMAYVCTATDSVKLREGPGKNYSVIKSLVPGADLKVIGGPTCADNWSWWKVETESGYVGWMSEGGDSVDRYFLCPRN